VALMAMRIASVCRVLPTPANRSAGQFVARRLGGMAQHAQVRIVQPIPFFPGLRPLEGWARKAAHEVDVLRVEHAPMLYLPGVLKSLDGRWLARSVSAPLGRMTAEGQLDVIDAHFAYPDGVGCVRVARSLGLPVFVTIRGVEVEQLELPLIGRQIISALQAASGVISVSHTLRDAVVAAGVDDERVRVIHNAVDRALFRPGDRRAARARLGLPASGHVIVSIGNMIELKRHHVLIEAVARARSAVPGLLLAILGGGESDARYPARLEKLAAELGVGDAVRLAERVPPEQVVDWLQSANIFALATSREGCCNAVLEALACGIPVVTTPAGDNAQFVRNAVSGFLVPIDDAEALARALVDSLQRNDWDPDAISAGLTVGDWSSVGREVLDFFAERMAA
jgi:glycosyltransferase involved in cell wall biosynthesis